jgi:hypothetical protein
MPEQATIRRANTKKREGKAPSTQAGEFVKEEIHHVREGKYGARSTKQAIAIGLSKARKAGVDLKPPRKGQTSESTRRSATQAYEKGQKNKRQRPSPRRSRATLGALRREGRGAASSTALVQTGSAKEITPVNLSMGEHILWVICAWTKKKEREAATVI